MYFELSPNTELKDYIDKYWYYEDHHELITVYPDGCFDLVITIKADKNKIILTGIWDEKQDVEVIKDEVQLGIRFKRRALDQFFTIKLKDIRNKIILFHENMLARPMTFDSIYDLREPEQIIEELIFIGLLEVTSDDFIYYSERHLRRLSKEKYGISPILFERIMRFRKAKELLEEGEKVLTIVHELGYSDQSHFTKEFKHFTGMTPKAHLDVRKIQDK